MQSHDAMNNRTGEQISSIPAWVIERLTLAEVGMYACIARYAGKDRKASPAGSELSRDSGVTRRQVLRIVASLEAKGVIKCHKKIGQSNTYELPMQPFVQQDIEVKSREEEDLTPDGNTGQYKGISYFRTPVHWVQFLNPTELLVAATIGSYTNKDLQCWPSIASIADRCNLSRPTVKRTINSLEEKGVISILRRYGAKGVPMSNLYQINVKMGSSANPV